MASRGWGGAADKKKMWKRMRNISVRLLENSRLGDGRMPESPNRMVAT
jgi:hypothetical protein